MVKSELLVPPVVVKRRIQRFYAVLAFVNRRFPYSKMQSDRFKNHLGQKFQCCSAVNISQAFKL